MGIRIFNNKNCENIIVSCYQEFSDINKQLSFLRPTNPMVFYLSRYSVIKAHSSIESSYKRLLKDYYNNCNKKPITNFLNDYHDDKPMRINYSSICSHLTKFDTAWEKNFSNIINSNPDSQKIIAALGSLKKIRNTIAHGGNISVSFKDIESYFNYATYVIKAIDDTII